MDPRQLDKAKAKANSNLSPLSIDEAEANQNLSPLSDDEDASIHGKPHQESIINHSLKVEENKEDKQDNLSSRRAEAMKKTQARLVAMNQLRAVLSGLMYNLNNTTFDPRFQGGIAYRQLHAIPFNYDTLL